MIAGRIAEVVRVTALATMVTAIIAAPVLRAPSERVFGMELVGRHHDPFTVMEQFERPVHLAVYSQPLTDVSGALLAMIAGPVIAYNWLVLLSFPLSAAAAYLLARHLALSPVGATVAAMAYAFSPFHVAHAAYHPHIAQTQWIPLYLLALWRCLDNGSLAAAGVLGAATMGVTLSNFYGGLIAAVITPVVVGAHWLVRCRSDPGETRRVALTLASLALLATSGVAYARHAVGIVATDPAALAFPRGDLFRYSARWWSYLMPPSEHPLLGSAARAVWQAAGVREGLLEQQVSLGWIFVALGLIAVLGWSVSGGNRARRLPSLVSVPILVLVAMVALVCSLSPERTIGSITIVRPAALLYDIVPMFRSYARFGVVVQLMTALLAGIGVDWIRRPGTTRGNVTCVMLVALAGAEYAVSPASLWRDVLPAASHRWVMRQSGRVHALDCSPANGESASVPWLSEGRISLLGGSITECTDGNLSRTLAANAYTHLIVRRGTPAGQWFATHAAPDGLSVAARFDDGEVFAVEAQLPAVHMAALSGFCSREHDGEWAWRWMGTDAAWTIVNATNQPIDSMLVLELSAFHHSRRLELRLDGQFVQTVVIDPSRQDHPLGPFTVSPGYHELVFHPVDAPTVAGDLVGTGDRRQLSFAFGAWNWRIPGEQP